ncbi:MAG: hypothetical protein AAF614_09810 [Chloroflexota bacterium]
MTYNDNFSEGEWFLVSSLPSMIGAAVATAGKSGFFGTMKEMMASARGMMEAQSEYANNGLIQAIVSQSGDKEDVKARAEKYQQMAMDKMKEAGVQTPEQLAQIVLEDCYTVSDLLAERVSMDEAAEYKTWSMSVGQKVAEAAKEGGFLGFGGERVSDSEETLLADVAAALNV